MGLVTIDYAMGVPAIQIARLVALPFNAEVVISEQAADTSLRTAIQAGHLNHWEEGLLRLAEANVGHAYFGLGPAASPPTPDLVGRLAKAAANDALVVAACPFGAETVGRRVQTTSVYVTAELGVRAQRVAREASIELGEALRVVSLADASAMAYRQQVVGRPLPDSLHHDLIINASTLDESAVASLIISYLRTSGRA